MANVVLHTASWSSGPVTVARTFWQRLRGLKSFDAVLIKTRSVHGIGMSSPFRAVGLDGQFEVRTVRVVEPGEVALFPNCRHVLELPMTAEPPAPGSKLEVVGV